MSRLSLCDHLSHQPPHPLGRTLKASAVKWQSQTLSLPIGITKIKPIANRLYKWLNQNLIKPREMCTRWSVEKIGGTWCHQESPVVPRNFNNEHVSWQRFHLVVLVHVRQLPTLKGFICELSNAKNPGRTIPTNPNPRA